MILAVCPFIFTFLLYMYTEGKLEEIALHIEKRMPNRRISNFLRGAFSPDLKYSTYRTFTSAKKRDILNPILDCLRSQGYEAYLEDERKIVAKKDRIFTDIIQYYGAILRGEETSLVDGYDRVLTITVRNFSLEFNFRLLKVGLAIGEVIRGALEKEVNQIYEEPTETLLPAACPLYVPTKNNGYFLKLRQTFNNAKVRLFLAIGILTASYTSLYLKMYGYPFSTLLAAILIGLSVYRINPPIRVLRHHRNQVPFNIVSVTQTGLAFSAIVEYVLVNMAMNVFQEIIGISYLQTIAHALILSIVSLSLISILLWQYQFIKWKPLAPLSWTVKRKYIEVSTITFVFVWFLGSGGGLIVNLLIVPPLFVYLLLYDLKRKNRRWTDMQASHGMVSKVIETLSGTNKKIWSGLLNSPRKPEAMWLAFMFYISASILTVNSRFYSFAEVSQSAFLVLVFLSVVFPLIGIVKNWKTPKCFIAIAPFLLFIPLVAMSPLSIPIIAYGVSQTAQPHESALAGFTFSLIFVAWFLAALSSYYMVLTSFLSKRGRSVNAIKRIVKTWRYGELIFLSAVIFIIGALYIAAGYESNIIFGNLSVGIIIFFLIFAIFEVGLQEELKAFRLKLKTGKKKSSAIIQPISISRRRLTIEGLFIQFLMPSISLLIGSLLAYGLEYLRIV